MKMTNVVETLVEPSSLTERTEAQGGERSCARSRRKRMESLNLEPNSTNVHYNAFFPTLLFEK